MIFCCRCVQRVWGLSQQSQYKYCKQLKKLNGTQLTLLGLVRNSYRDVHDSYRESNSPTDALNITAMLTNKSVKLSRWRTPTLIKKLHLINFQQQPGYPYKKAPKEYIEICNYLEYQFTVTELNQVQCDDMSYI